MQRLEVSGAVRPIYGSLGVKWLINSYHNKVTHTHSRICMRAPRKDSNKFNSAPAHIQFKDCPSPTPSHCTHTYTYHTNMSH